MLRAIKFSPSARPGRLAGAPAGSWKAMQRRLQSVMHPQLGAAANECCSQSSVEHVAGACLSTTATCGAATWRTPTGVGSKAAPRAPDFSCTSRGLSKLEVSAESLVVVAVARGERGVAVGSWQVKASRTSFGVNQASSRVNSGGKGLRRICSFSQQAVGRPANACVEYAPKPSRPLQQKRCMHLRPQRLGIPRVAHRAAWPQSRTTPGEACRGRNPLRPQELQTS